MQHAKLVSPSRVVQEVPKLLGSVPVMSGIVVGLNDNMTAACAVRVTMGASPSRAIRTLIEHHCKYAVLLVYGRLPVYDDVPYSTYRRVLSDTVRSFEIEVVDELYVNENNCWWSYLCDDADCCPPEGSEVKQ